VSSKRTRKSVVASNLVEDSNLPNHERVIEKDETEEKLEKLIFGDDAGFLDSLKADTTGQELLRISNSSGEGEHSGSDKDFHEAADKDVRSALMLRTDA
jgi:U3 small nucleolar RNA-associated protein 18